MAKKEKKDNKRKEPKENYLKKIKKYYYAYTRMVHQAQQGTPCASV